MLKHGLRTAVFSAVVEDEGEIFAHGGEVTVVGGEDLLSLGQGRLEDGPCTGKVAALLEVEAECAAQQNLGRRVAAFVAALRARIDELL